MLKNTEFVIYSYGIFTIVVAVYIVGIFFKLKKVNEKLHNLGEDNEQ